MTNLSMSALRMSLGARKAIPYVPPVAPVIAYNTGTSTFYNVDTLGGQWVIDGVNTGPSNATSLAYVQATMEGRYIGQKIGGVLSNVIVVEATNPVTTENFNRTDGTKLTDIGFTLMGGNTGEGDKYTCQGNRMRVSPINGSITPPAIMTKNTGSVEHLVEATISDDSAIAALGASIGDANNYIGIEPAGAGLWHVMKKIAGVSSDVTPNRVSVAGSSAVGKSYSLAIKDGKWQIRLDGLPYAESSGYGTPAAQVDIWYNLPAGLGTGQSVAIVGDIYGGTKFLDNFRSQSLTQPISITSVEVFQDGLDQKLRIIGKADANALNNAVILVTNDETEALVLDWTAVTGAPGAPGGAFTVTSGALPSAIGGIQAHVYLSDSTARQRTTSAIIDAPVAMRGFSKGINNSNAGVNYRNLFSRMEVYFPQNSYQRLRQAGDTLSGNIPATAVGMGYDGVIQSYVSGFAANIKYGCNGVFIEQGIYEIYYDAALSCTLTNYDGLALSGVTVLTAFSGGYGKIQISVDKPSLCFTFTGGTNGSLNLKPTGYLVADTDRSRLYAESSIVPFATANAKVERHLDSLLGNGDNVIRLTAAQVWVGGNGVYGPFSPEMIAQKANAQGSDVWIPCSYLWQGTEYLTAFFTRLVAALDVARKVYVEPPNETWNSIFAAYNWSVQKGFDAGFWNANGDAAPVTSLRAIPGVDNDPATGNMLTSYSMNDIVMFDLYNVGRLVAKAKKNIVTGAADKLERSGSLAIDNAAWQIIAQNGDCMLAQKRWYAHWADFLWNIVDAVCVTAGYDPRVKTVRVLAWQTGNPPLEILQWNGIHARLDAWAEAPYWSGDILNYDYSPMTLTEKNLLGTDIPAFKAAFNSYATAAVAAKVAEFPARKANSDAVFASLGYPANAKRLISYEMGWHITTQPDVTDGATGHWHSNMATVFPQLRRQSIFQTWTTDYYTGWKNVYHEVACQFNGVGELPDSYNGQYGYWPLMEHNNDITNPGILGFAAVTNET